MIKELKDFRNVKAEDFNACWEQYLQTKEWRYDRCYLIDLIYNYNCDGIEHLKATDDIDNEVSPLFKALDNAEDIEDWDKSDKICEMISAIIDFFFTNDYQLMKILVDELMEKMFS